MTTLSTGFKYAAYSGGVGLVGGVAYAMLRKKSPSSSPETHASTGGSSDLLQDVPLPNLSLHDDLYGRCRELAAIRHVSPESFRTVCTGVDAILGIAREAAQSDASTVRGAWPGMARYAAAHVTSALERLEGSGGSISDEEFNEIASTIQSTIHHLQQNIVHEVSVKMSG